MKNKLMIYGANGYSAKLILEELLSRNIKPVLAGRNKDDVTELAKHHDCEFRIFNLESDEIIKRNLEDVHTVLNCAGPFMYTAKELIDSCLSTRTNYLDITGEMPVLAYAFNCSEKAKENKIVIMPSVGFDIIPTDCLAKRMKDLLLDAADLKIALLNRKGKISRGTLLTSIEFMGGKGKVRRDGKVINSEIGEYQIHIDHKNFSFDAISIPWGDVFTAYLSTGIPNITVYYTVPKILMFKPVLKLAMRIMNDSSVKRFVQNYIKRNIVGPNEKERMDAKVFIWCKVENAKGESNESIVEVMEGYTLTAKGAAESAVRVMNNLIEPGAYTPSLAFGSSYLDLFTVDKF